MVPISSLLRYLKKMVLFTRRAVVYHDLEPDSVRQAQELSQMEIQYGFRTVKMFIRKSDDIKKLVFAGKADVGFIAVSSAVNEAIDTIVKKTHAAKIPTVSLLGGMAEHGVILSLSLSYNEQGEAARMTAQLLRGENPLGVPVEMPNLTRLVLNLKEAESLEITVPPDLISEATRVIK
jgi:putative tryptophan/tyrosine transport system substrate-binding protein